jgi:hypothetical protein
MNWKLVLHQKEMETMWSMPLGESPRLLMALTGPVIGLVSGIVIGLLASIGGKLVRIPRAPD